MFQLLSNTPLFVFTLTLNPNYSQCSARLHSPPVSGPHQPCSSLLLWSEDRVWHTEWGSRNTWWVNDGPLLWPWCEIIINTTRTAVFHVYEVMGSERCVRSQVFPCSHPSRCSGWRPPSLSIYASAPKPDVLRALLGGEGAAAFSYVLSPGSGLRQDRSLRAGIRPNKLVN